MLSLPEFSITTLFTIQNVPIKSKVSSKSVVNENNLQYKMFLLNEMKEAVNKSLEEHLQYKMFLLNTIGFYDFIKSSAFTIQNVPIKLEYKDL